MVAREEAKYEESSMRPRAGDKAQPMCGSGRSVAVRHEQGGGGHGQKYRALSEQAWHE
jgi:hypothetical protein